jgi:CBS domain-containing protein
MLVSELIGGPVLTCTPETTITEAARVMVSNDAGSLAVMVDNDMVGIVTERDLIVCIWEQSPGTTPVSEVMTPQPDSLESDVSLKDAADWMLAAGYRHLPVVDNGKLVGMLSIKDVLWGIADSRA